MNTSLGKHTHTKQRNNQGKEKIMNNSIAVMSKVRAVYKTVVHLTVKSLKVLSAVFPSAVDESN